MRLVLLALLPLAAAPALAQQSAGSASGPVGGTAVVALGTAGATIDTGLDAAAGQGTASGTAAAPDTSTAAAAADAAADGTAAAAAGAGSATGGTSATGSTAAASTGTAGTATASTATASTATVGVTVVTGASSATGAPSATATTTASAAGAGATGAAAAGSATGSDSAAAATGTDGAAASPSAATDSAAAAAASPAGAAAASAPLEFRTMIGDKPIEITGDKATAAFEQFRQTGTNPFHGDEAALAEGRKLYAKLCQACHMPDGSGRIGPSLTDDLWRNPRLETEAGRFEIIHSGGAGAMQAFHPRMSTDEMLKVMAYIDTFRGG